MSSFTYDTVPNNHLIMPQIPSCTRNFAFRDIAFLSYLCVFHTRATDSRRGLSSIKPHLLPRPTALSQLRHLSGDHSKQDPNLGNRNSKTFQNSSVRFLSGLNIPSTSFPFAPLDHDGNESVTQNLFRLHPRRTPICT